MQVVETLTQFGVGCHQVVDDDAATDTTDARHLAQLSLRVGEMVNGEPTEDEVERLVDEGQRGGVTFLQQDVGDAALA